MMTFVRSCWTDSEFREGGERDVYIVLAGALLASHELPHALVNLQNLPVKVTCLYYDVPNHILFNPLSLDLCDIQWATYFQLD